MNIAFFLDIPVGLGGAGNLLLNQAAVMKDIHNVVVGIPINYDGKENPEYALRCDKAGLRYFGLDYRTSFRIQDIDIVRAQRDYISVLSFLRDERIDFVHCVQLNVTVELAAKTLGIPCLMNVYQINENEFFLSCNGLLSRYHSSDSILYCNTWKDGLGVKSQCIRPISPIDEIIIKEKKKKITHVVMTGDVCEYKNALAGIQSVEQMIKKGKYIELHILGYDSSEYANECKKYVADNKLSDNIHFYGFVRNVYDVLNDMDVYMCTSKWESFPSSMVDAVSYGLSIISTPIAGVPELMKDKENAFVSKDFSIESIVSSLEDYFEAVENGDIQRIAKNAQKTWEENFSRDTIRNRLDEYYTDIIEEFESVSEKDTDPFVSFLENQITVDSNSIYNYISESPYGNPPMLRRAYYFACMKKSVEEYGQVYIWGCGRYGRFVYDFIKRFTPDIKIKAFVDSFKNGEFEGVKIIRPEEVNAESNDVMIVSTIKDITDLLSSCERKGFINNKTLWHVP